MKNILVQEQQQQTPPEQPTTTTTLTVDTRKLNYEELRRISEQMEWKRIKFEEEFVPETPEFAAPDWELWCCERCTTPNLESWKEATSSGDLVVHAKFPSRTGPGYKVRRVAAYSRYFCVGCNVITVHTLWRPL